MIIFYRNKRMDLYKRLKKSTAQMEAPHQIPDNECKNELNKGKNQ